MRSPEQENRPIEILAAGIAIEAEAGLVGHARFDALAAAALARSGAGVGTPVVIGSCNGAAEAATEVDWLAAFSRPSASAACASGLHALFIARALLLSGATDEVVALSVDIHSAANRSNFDVLRVTAGSPQLPWQEDTDGFELGEAAVALRLGRAGSGGMPIWGPTLANDDMARALAGVDARDIDLIAGQGTGPVAVDRAELDVLDRFDGGRASITSPVYQYGHTLGSSGTLALALLAGGRDVELPAATTSSGRAISRSLASRRAVVACRAMGGACAVVTTIAQAARPAQWIEPTDPGPIMIPAARAMVAAAAGHRPLSPPAALVVRLEQPLLPPERARIGGRLLPSAILEMTPGFLAIAVARRWGYDGPTLCIVGGLPGSSPASGKNPQSAALSGIEAVADVLGETSVIYVRGDGHEREVRWPA